GDGGGRISERRNEDAGRRRRGVGVLRGAAGGGGPRWRMTSLGPRLRCLGRVMVGWTIPCTEEPSCVSKLGHGGHNGDNAVYRTPFKRQIYILKTPNENHVLTPSHSFLRLPPPPLQLPPLGHEPHVLLAPLLVPVLHLLK